MIDSQLRPNGVTDKALLEAMADVRREHYLPEGKRSVAYRDRAIALEDGRNAIAPTPLALMIDRAAPQTGEKALVVGPVAAYAAALLTEMGLDAVALESKPGEEPAGDGVILKTGTLTDGVADLAPYDLILLVGAIEELGEALTAQLADNGRVAAPVIDGGVSRLAIGRKVDGAVAFRNFADAQVAPLALFSKARTFEF
nr:protein-L-isoaspartate O-methyltransferase [Sphingomicrobium aestuariivivum]